MESLEFNNLLKRLKYDKRALGKIYCEYYSRIIFHINRVFQATIGEDVAQDFFITLQDIAAEHEYEYIHFPTS